MGNPLFKKKALDALLEMINDSDYATHQHHSDPDYSTQNGKMYEKGTEPEDGALLASSPNPLIETDPSVPGPPDSVEDAEFFKEGEPEYEMEAAEPDAEPVVRPSQGSEWVRRTETESKITGILSKYGYTYTAPNADGTVRWSKGKEEWVIFDPVKGRWAHFNASDYHVPDVSGTLDELEGKISQRHNFERVTAGFKDSGVLTKEDALKFKRWWEDRGHAVQLNETGKGQYRVLLKLNVQRKKAPTPVTASEHGNVPDLGEGKYDFKHEAHVREEMKTWAQYAEPKDNTDDIKPFDPSGMYLCGSCDMRRDEDQCMRVEGPISFGKGSCRMYHLGSPETAPDMERKFTKKEAKYSEHLGGFSCKRCEYGSEARGEDPDGRPSWCAFWGTHILPDACCSEWDEDDKKKTSSLVQIADTKSYGTGTPIGGTTNVPEVMTEEEDEDTVAEAEKQAAFNVDASFDILAANYEEMFKGLLALAPQSEKFIDKEIEWAKRTLKKQDRIVWYLRWYRLALVKELMDDEATKKTVPARLGQPQQAAAAPQQQTLGQPPAPQAQPAPPPEYTLYDSLKAFYEQCRRDLMAKKGDPNLAPPLENFSSLKQNMEHFLSLPVPEIQNRVLKAESIDDISDIYENAESDWKERAKRLLKPQEGDKIWMQFPDGWAWWWLPRAACDAEAKAMGHCGNKPRSGRSDMTILSLRQPKKIGKETQWEPHLTFILHGEGETGMLGEMKGRGNDKPAVQYHPYIVALLKDNRIHGFVGATWFAEHNFKMSDLTEEQRQEIYAANPDLKAGNIREYYNKHGMDEKLVRQLASIFELPAVYDQQYGFVIRRFESTDVFLEECGNHDVRAALRYAKGETGHGSPVPDNDDLITFVIDYGNDTTIANVGLSLMYEFPAEARDWFSPAYEDNDGRSYEKYNPGDKDHVKRFLELLVEPYQTAEKAVYPNVPVGEEEKPDPNEYKYRTIKTLDEIKDCYYGGMTDIDSVSGYLDDAVREMMEEGAAPKGTLLVENSAGEVLQIVDLPPDELVGIAENVQNEKQDRPEFEEPSISIPYEWDEWERRERWRQPQRDFCVVPEAASKRQAAAQAVPEPKSLAEAKRKGITVSNLHNSLLRYAGDRNIDSCSLDEASYKVASSDNISWWRKSARPTEQKIELLKRQFDTTPEQVELCIAADPSPNQSDYVAWLAKWLSKGQLNLPEDTEKVKEQLALFQKLKRSPNFTGNKDIQQYDPGKLYETLEESSGAVSKKQEQRDVVSKGTTVVYKRVTSSFTR